VETEQETRLSQGAPARARPNDDPVSDDFLFEARFGEPGRRRDHCACQALFMSRDDEMVVLSRRLGLLEAEQDWGIANGDADRLGEFLDVYACEARTSGERSLMAELLLASANECLTEGATDGLERFAEALARIRADASWEFEYWLEQGCFPLAAYLRARLPTET
jgi:hypothetical protein